MRKKKYTKKMGKSSQLGPTNPTPSDDSDFFEFQIFLKNADVPLG